MQWRLRESVKQQVTKALNLVHIGASISVFALI